MSTDTENFRLQNRRVHLTYKTHIDPQIWLSWFYKTKKQKIEFYSIVHEKGNSITEYDHTHILIDAGKGKMISTKNSRYFDWTLPNKEIIHPHIKPVTSKKHWEQSIAYHYKESIPFTNIKKPELESEIKEVWKHDKLSDALLATCSNLKNVGGVIAAFNCKPTDYGIEPNITWKPWQKDLITETEQKPNDRTIVWNYDPKGGSGKSYLAKYMGQFRGAFVSTKADTYHVATSIDEFIKSNGPNSILVIIFNFTRQQQNKNNIYQALEELKDGMITSEKYKGRTIFFPHPHLICFSNYLPEVSCFTSDRWDIRTIQDDKIVKRHLGGKVIFEDAEIDPYTNYTLKSIEDEYEKLNSDKSKLDENYQRYLLDQKTKKNSEPERPLNINTGTLQLASLVTPAEREHPASQGLASLERKAPEMNKSELPKLLNQPSGNLAYSPVRCLPPLKRTK